MAAKKEYRALVDIDYLNTETKEMNHASAGDKITDMSENAARNELRAENIEEWVERDTENVRDLERRGALNTYGVVVEENGDGNMILKGVNDAR